MRLSLVVQSVRIVSLTTVVCLASGCGNQLQDQSRDAGASGISHEVRLIELADAYDRPVPVPIWWISEHPDYFVDSLGHIVPKAIVVEAIQNPDWRLKGRNVIQVIFATRNPDAVNARMLLKITQLVYDATRDAKPPPSKVIIDFALPDMPPVEKGWTAPGNSANSR